MNRYPISAVTVLRINMVNNGFSRITVSESLCHIFSDEPRIAVFSHRPQFSELLILKYLHPVFHIFSSFLIQPAPAAWW